MTSEIDTAQLRQTLEKELRRVRTPEDAEQIVAELERLAAGKTEQSQGQAAERDPSTPAREVERAGEAAAGTRRGVAAVLAETAQQTASKTPEGEAASEAARKVLNPAAAAAAPGVARAPSQAPSASDAPPVEPESARGAELLKDAVLRRLGPLQALDAKVFLGINRAPHPAWSDRLANLVTIWTTGGWIWAAPLFAARLFGLERAGRALVVLLPCLAGATWIVEFPVKAFFRRRRPFIDVVRALVVGKKPGSWSFPSGHSASSFAAAWTLSTIWPRRAPLFFALATIIGFSRIYVGAHYPGDVTSGAFLGMTLAELLRQALKHSVLKRSRLWP